MLRFLMVPALLLALARPAATAEIRPKDRYQTQLADYIRP
jgi:hypothetical protein